VTALRSLLAGINRRPLWTLGGWTIFEALPALLAGQLIAHAMDRGFLAGRTAVGLGYLAVLGAVHVLAALAVRQSYPAAGTVVDALRDRLVRRVVDATLRRAVTGTAAPDQAAVTRMVQQVEVVRDVTAGLLLIVRKVVLTTVAAVLGLFSLAPALLVIVGPPLALSLAIFGVLMVLLARRQRDLVLAEESIAGTAAPIMTGIRDVVALGAERHASAVVGAVVDRHFRAAQALGRASTLRALVVSLGVHVPVILVLVTGPGLVRDGVSLGAIVGAITYLTVSLEPALRMLVQAIAAAALRLTITFRRLAETTSVPATPTPAPAVSPSGHRIQFEDVTYAYGDGDPIVSDLGLSVPEGDHLAIIGPSGIGKSTLAELVVGLQQPNAGRVLLGGVPVDRIDPRQLHADVVLIPQQAYIFTGTLQDNLGYLRPDVPSHEIGTAVDLLGLSPLVEHVGGYHAQIQPTALSAGERQLIALARAYVSTARTVILDEATSHLDPVLEARAEQAFAARPGTLVVIAHRLTSAMRANRILLIDGARPFVGTHESLLVTSALYRDLVGLWDGVSV
jgi:ATP-binding cassette subfamily C protein